MTTTPLSEQARQADEAASRLQRIRAVLDAGDGSDDSRLDQITAIVGDRRVPLYQKPLG